VKREKKDKHFIKKPVYPGGLKAMRKFIFQELKYPAEAIEHKIEGTVRIKYDIDYKGNVVGVFVQNSIGYGCDEEAERIVRKLKFNVAKTRKTRVIFHKTIQIYFKLPKVKPVMKPVPVVPTVRKITYSYSTTKSKSTTTKTPTKKPTVYSYTLNIKK